MLMSKSPDGRGIPQLSLHEAKDKTIVVDLNHLLAGKRLNFDVKVTDSTAVSKINSGLFVSRRNKKTRCGSPSRATMIEDPTVLTNRPCFFPMSLD
jgi:FKBP-type peptidyl-prolyl cis-trans isomerase 2